ncbi:MAG: preprotein translocase subunit SecG [Eubacteriales bacterium]|nr:preprotein translocase subunit SecG [Eubacteriales bacterium]
MEIATNIVLVLHLIVSVVLIAVVLLQSGNQAGLSGAIAGGAETFFGKNKGKTLDGILKKWTAAVAILFVITSVVLSLFLTK